MPDSAFSQDEAKRQQQDAAAKLARSVGVRDEEGNQLHGRARTERAREMRAEMKAASKAQEKPDAPKQPDAKPLAQAKPDDLRIAINAPHKAVVRGNQVALTIIQGDGDGGEVASSPLTPLKLVSGATAGMLRVVYGTIGGMSATGMSPGDVPIYEFTPSGSSGKVYAIMSLNADFGITGFTITSGGSVPSNTTSAIYIEIGSYGTSGGVLVPAHALAGSLSVVLCGSATSEVPVVTLESV